MSLQTVVITGANRGIGLEMVRQLLASMNPPQHLIATSRQGSNEELDKLKALNPRLSILRLDTTDFRQFDSFAKQVELIVEDLGVDTLINNAGVYIRNELDSVTAEDVIKNFEVNTVAPLMLSKAMLPLLRGSAIKRKTSIVNIGSVMGSIELNEKVEGKPHIGGYGYRTSKAALNMVSKCLSIDLKSDGIQVITLHPGWVKTDMGGPDADLEVHKSVSNIINTIESINESISGKLVNFDGTILPF